MDSISHWIIKVPDWGTVPAFLSAVLGGAALIIAVRTWAHTRRKDSRAQADQVAVWSDTVDDHGGIRIFNNSALPIYFVMVYSASIEYEAGLGQPVGLSEGKESMVAPAITCVPAGGMFIPVSAYDEPGCGLGLTYEIEFTDSAQQRWRRDGLGKLTKVKSFEKAGS